jgi:hypothetical protein
MAAIKQSLGQYLKGGPNMIDAVELLCPMLDMDNEWVWAEADQKDWDLLIEEVGRTRKTLGIRQSKDVGQGKCACPCVPVRGVRGCAGLRSGVCAGSVIDVRVTYWSHTPKI